MTIDHVSSEDLAAAMECANSLRASGGHLAASLMKRLADEVLIMRAGCFEGVTADPRAKAEYAALAAIPDAVSSGDAALLSSLAATLTALRAR